MNSSTPLFCNMSVFTPAQRDDHIQVTIELVQAIQSVHEVENGYVFSFPNKTDLISKATQFILNERLCCPFLIFNLQVNASHEPISLSLTGPAGTQEFLRLEFDEVFQRR